MHEWRTAEIHSVVLRQGSGTLHFIQTAESLAPGQGVRSSRRCVTQKGGARRVPLLGCVRADVEPRCVDRGCPKKMVREGQGRSCRQVNEGLVEGHTQERGQSVVVEEGERDDNVLVKAAQAPPAERRRGYSGTSSPPRSRPPTSSCAGHPQRHPRA